MDDYDFAFTDKEALEKAPKKRGRPKKVEMKDLGAESKIEIDSTVKIVGGEGPSPTEEIKALKKKVNLLRGGILDGLHEIVNGRLPSAKKLLNNALEETK